MDTQTEIIVRLSAFAGVLLAMTLWELSSPRRKLAAGKGGRWTSNLLLVAINTVAARLIIPVTAVAAALTAESGGWGLLHQVAWPYWLEVTLAVIALDLVIYFQHVLFHAVPALWRLHKVHHADLDVDVTTGIRFHTLEILLSALLKLAAVVAFGAPALAVVLFEVILNATSMFNHSNVKMPEKVDRLLRWIVVTPDMHRIHHSIIRRETDSNFGFNLPWWDRLLGTYRSDPQEGHERMTLGITDYREEDDVERLHHMLLIPFRRAKQATTARRSETENEPQG
ncbi:Fatty acid hydroxylase superfamily protein [Maioricimonas rarisocia]|uniref:Fatty acid hydroxylase superfamily protein n=1 Tax=Maioricimonas rarisocia TaxID=2528026 RepID=A0A517ZCI6_9PLAN|nr:sterol desaturase family protein [Maioricimonas rarisocia]QDU40161.1 Fatty acid hydroxylase superfamily protein [Maioricimonas rarisocia]